MASPGTGKNHPNWKGGRVTITSQPGNRREVLIWLPPEDPLRCMCNKCGYVLEHRLVMARYLGRPLTREEKVHHRNGNSEDNRFENLIYCPTQKFHMMLEHRRIRELEQKNLDLELENIQLKKQLGVLNDYSLL